ncbi:MAG: DNA/RNA nuclease SfsA [Leptolyngbyaceae cyanobacterium HOT.MB2.61]|jgi:sugar fermentation stimulation protein A|nr:DNA/RNA nuclease SfsA [Leptolyngbyaceae cyanobacterium HOT.MB2.61]
MTDLLYQYPLLYPGILLKRYKRFFADVELTTGEIITAHCPNTGPMTGVCTPGSRVQVSHTDSPTRKLQYTLEMIEVHDNRPTWVGVNTSLPNRIVNLALTQRVIPRLEDYTTIRYEVPYGTDRKSRIDFLLTGDSCKPIYIEVKNTTWVQGEIALFPDTVTTRGQKHLRELMALLPEATAVMLYFINRGDCPYFSPGDRADPVYGRLLREAIALGIKVLPCRFEISPQGVRYLGLAELKL